MGAKKGGLVLSVLAGAVILLIDLYGYHHLRASPSFPPGTRAKEILRMDGTEIRGIDDIDWLLPRKAPGDPVELLIKTPQGEELSRVTLLPMKDSFPYLVIYLLIGFFTAGIGFVCLLLRPDDVRTRFFYWLSLTFASALILTGGHRLITDAWPSYLPGAFFYVSYAFALPLMLLFFLSFSERPQRTVRIAGLASGLLFSAVLVWAFLKSTQSPSVDTFRSIYVPVYTAFRIFSVVIMFLSIFVLVSPFRNAGLRDVRESFKWIILGLLLSLVPFCFLYQLPRVLLRRPLVPEEFAALFFIFAPLSVIFSIFRFRLFNFELVIRRSLVYSILTVFTVGLYMLSVQVFNQLFVRWLHVRSWGATAAGVLLAAAMFRPAQSRIQGFVDKAFFRQSFDYRRSLKAFAEGAREIADRKRLVDFFLETLDSILPLERAGICVHDVSGEVAEVYLESGDCAGLLDQDASCFEPGTVLATRRAAGPSVGADFSRESWLIRAGWELIIPLSFKASPICGVLGLGLKKSGQTFSREDTDLIDGLAGELAVHLERIRLHEEVISERASREKLDELNRLKTEFISTFSHELRTPMSSIQSLAEMLGSGKVKDRIRRDALLGTISAESGRLSRMIHNILDFGKIEHRAKTFSFRATDIREVINEALEVFRHELDARGFSVEVDVPDRPVVIEADRDAMKQALINLIDNAMKYTAATKEIGIRILEEPSRVEVQVWDRGIGIPEDEREKIFEEFYREPRGVRLNPKGVGLGLKIVKHIVESHGGRVLVDGGPGHGSTFRLVFPKP